MSSEESIQPGTMLPLTERERRELLIEVDQMIAEIDDRRHDGHEHDVRAHSDDS